MPEQLKQQNLAGAVIYNKCLTEQLEKKNKCKPVGGHMHP